MTKQEILDRLESIVNKYGRGMSAACMIEIRSFMMELDKNIKSESNSDQIHSEPESLFDE